MCVALLKRYISEVISDQSRKMAHFRRFSRFLAIFARGGPQLGVIGTRNQKILKARTEISLGANF